MKLKESDRVALESLLKAGYTKIKRTKYYGLEITPDIPHLCIIYFGRNLMDKLKERRRI